MMGGAQVLQVAPPYMPPMPQPVPAAAALPPPPAAVAAAVPPAGGAVAQHIVTLEATIQRLEESFAFAVECMQTDMAQAKEQLRQLKATVGA